ncbi:MAG: hypothetical protein U0528_04720 [Anaerolineae bacterium]
MIKYCSRVLLLPLCLLLIKYIAGVQSRHGNAAHTDTHEHGIANA